MYFTLAFLFSTVTVSFYFSSVANLRFVNCCTNKGMNELMTVLHNLLPSSFTQLFP